MNDAAFWECTRQEYDDATDYLRSSQLKDFRVSPKIYYWRYVANRMPQKSQTSEMLFGTLFHALVLEGEQQWNVSGNCEAEIKSGNRKGQVCGNPGAGTEHKRWLCGVHSKGKELESPPNLISKSDEDDLWGMKESLEESTVEQGVDGKTPLQILSDCTNEHAVRWKDRNYGIKCKALLDGLGFDGHIPDLKTTGEFNPDSIWRKVVNNGWGFSSAFYERGVNNVLPPVKRDWQYVVVERHPPYRITTISMWNDAEVYQNQCRMDVEEELKALAKCREAGVYPDKRQNMTMPQWVGYLCNEAGSHQ